MTFKQFLLQEMIVHQSRNSGEKNCVVAFRSHLWLFDRYDDVFIKQMVDTIVGEHPKAFNPKISLPDNYDDLHDWIENITDAISGTINNKVLYINYSMLSPITSPLIKKVVETLKLRKVSYSNYQNYSQSDDEEKDFQYGKNQMLGRLPNSFYHGTTTSYLPNILKIGLNPGASESNWKRQGIYHRDRVFLASRFEDASFHSSNASSIQKGFPVVIQFLLPDSSQIAPDHDVDAMSQGEKTYAHRATDFDNQQASVNNKKLTTHTGLIAYTGRIPASFIQAVYLRINKQWRKVRLDHLKARIMRDPYEWTYYYSGLQPA